MMPLAPSANVDLMVVAAVDGGLGILAVIATLIIAVRAARGRARKRRLPSSGP
jgi:hypothetical protein